MIFQSRNQKGLHQGLVLGSPIFITAVETLSGEMSLGFPEVLLPSVTLQN